MANVNQQKWGVCYDGISYILFPNGYPSSFPITSVAKNTGVTLDTSAAPSFVCSSGGIIFDQISGKTSAATLSVTQGALTSTITLNEEGRIDW
jgi:hypothetical protein